VYPAAAALRTLCIQLHVFALLLFHLHPLVLCIIGAPPGNNRVWEHTTHTRATRLSSAQVAAALKGPASPEGQPPAAPAARASARKKSDSASKWQEGRAAVCRLTEPGVEARGQRRRRTRQVSIGADEAVCLLLLLAARHLAHLLVSPRQGGRCGGAARWTWRWMWRRALWLLGLTGERGQIPDLSFLQQLAPAGATRHGQPQQKPSQRGRGGPRAGLSLRPLPPPAQRQLSASSPSCGSSSHSRSLITS
jgi:hypothetical protein